MNKSRCTKEKMVAILWEANRSSVAKTAKKRGFLEQTLYNWRKHLGELEPANIKRLRALEAENATLKRLVAEHGMAIDTIKEINHRKW